MPPYTDSLTEAIRRYELWSDAEIKVAAGQAYSIGGRSLTRANQKEIQSTLEYLDKRILVLRARAARGGIRIRGAVPLP
jgi:hypothetical protein